MKNSKSRSDLSPDPSARNRSRNNFHRVRTSSLDERRRSRPLMLEQLEERTLLAVVAPGGLRAIPAAFTALLPSDIKQQVDDVLGAGGPADAMLYAALPGETNNVVVTSSYFDFFLQADDDPSVPILRIPPVFNRAFFDSLGAIGASITIGIGGNAEIGADGEGEILGGLAGILDIGGLI